jgi:hypothetical protein
MKKKRLDLLTETPDIDCPPVEFAPTLPPLLKRLAFLWTLSSFLELVS